MTEQPLTVTEIVTWYRSKQRSLEGSGISLDDVRERIVFLPGAIADFTCGDVMGRINGWVSGEFDFEGIRISDKSNLSFWRHIRVSTVEELENVFEEFIQYLRSQD